MKAAEFYATAAAGRTVSVAPGGDVAFAQDGPSNGSGITRTGDATFQLAEAGTYLLQFNVYATDPCPLVLTVDGEEIPYTISGGVTAQCVGTSVITTQTANALVTVRNPAANTTSLTMTAQDGVVNPVSRLVITRLCS